MGQSKSRTKTKRTARKAATVAVRAKPAPLALPKHLQIDLSQLDMGDMQLIAGGTGKFSQMLDILQRAVVGGISQYSADSYREMVNQLSDAIVAYLTGEEKKG